MKAFFDTSVLIPVFLEDHEHHERSLAAFLGAGKARDCCAAHSLAEVYSAMTRLPGSHRLSGEQAMLFLGEIRDRLALIALTGTEYYAAIREAAAVGIVGGTIYDVLIARCALKAAANTIYTWNIRHFERFGPAIAERLRTP
ncbi:MAG: PIN domain-containing protein [Candidatus Binataceae bacterium]